MAGRAGQKAPDAAQLNTAKAQRAAIWQEAIQKVAALAPPVEATPVADAKPAPPLALNAADFGRAISFDFAKNLAMDEDDVAGDVTRVGHWNNLRGVKEGATTEVQNVVDSTGKSVALRVSLDLLQKCFQPRRGLLFPEPGDLSPGRDHRFSSGG